jgi:SAM-dependent methyltransferase
MTNASDAREVQRELVTDHALRELYDDNPEYVARRDASSHSARQIDLEVRRFKVAGLLAVLPPDFGYRRVTEIGCATGELLAAFPGRDGTDTVKKGFDISPLNVAAARSRYPHIEFVAGDFRASEDRADIVILSDILEHVPDDVGFLRAAALRGAVVLINLPLEVNWLNARRKYGLQDPSGHLRTYSLQQGFDLLSAAGLEILHWRQLWSHETQYDCERRSLRRECLGHAYSGGPATRVVKGVLHTLARAAPTFGRRLYPSNLFVSAAPRR